MRSTRSSSRRSPSTLEPLCATLDLGSRAGAAGDAQRVAPVDAVPRAAPRAGADRRSTSRWRCTRRRRSAARRPTRRSRRARRSSRASTAAPTRGPSVGSTPPGNGEWAIALRCALLRRGTRDAVRRRRDRRRQRPRRRGRRDRPEVPRVPRRAALGVSDASREDGRRRVGLDRRRVELGHCPSAIGYATTAPR